jgi:hypothetical protein
VVHRIALALALLGGVAWAGEPVTLSGRAIDHKTQEPLAGVTVVASDVDGEQVAITDENGRFDLVVPHGTVRLTYYYMESSIEQVHVVAPTASVLDVGAVLMPEPKSGGGCVFPGLEWFGIYGQSPFGQQFERRTWPVVRQRDTDALRDLVAASAPGTVRIGGATRLFGGPALALGLLEEVTVTTMRGDAPLPAGGGVDLEVRTGSNENHGTARIALADDAAALEASVGGPIVEDNLWWSAAAVLGDGIAPTRQALAAVNYALGFDQQGETVALHADAPAAVPGARIVTATRNDWADTSWRSRFDDNRLQLVEGVTGERLERGDVVTTRLAGRAMLDRYQKLLGRHSIKIGGELGGGDAGEIRHRDATVYARDHYDPTPSFSIDTGVRYDWRAFGDARAHVWQPHATVAWDWTGEGRSELFVTGVRRATFDDRALGAWVGTPLARNDVAAGVRYEIADNWLGALAGRATDAVGPRHAGVDASLDHRSRRLELHVTAATIERVVAGFAELTAVRGPSDALLVGAAGRAAIHADPSVPPSGIGASARWQHRSQHLATTALGVEVFRDMLGSSARGVVGVDF